MDGIFPYGHFCDPRGVPNQKIWVANTDIFFCISVLSRPPCGYMFVMRHAIFKYLRSKSFMYKSDKFLTKVRCNWVTKFVLRRLST